MRRRSIFPCLFALALAVCASALARRAEAYPQFQFSSGTNRCGQCHYSPAGGGLITSWGRDESGDTISLGGSGAFLHGAWTPPSWLALGADIRYAGVRENVGGSEAPESAWFPMQADAYARFSFTDAISLYLEGGVRGETRPTGSSISSSAGTIATGFGTVADRFISREHYLMWRPSATGPYVRVGRFFAPYGLRFVEHIFFVRRFTGYNLYEETYTASGGIVDDDWELHVSAFTPPPTSFPDSLSSVGVRENGVAAYAEKRFAGMSALALQSRVGVGTETTRYQGGAVGKLWLDAAKLLFLGEADLVRQQVRAASAGENQFVSYLGATVFPVKGVMAGVAYERFQEDLSLSRSARNAADLQVNFFPWAHFELLLFARFQQAGTGTGDNPTASLYMLQLHYYL